VPVPPGGALAPELLVAANRGAGNPDDAAGIEVLGQLVVRAQVDVVVASDRDGTRELRAGEELVIASGDRRCAYLAIRGGVDAPIMLGSRGTLLCAELGRPLRAGDIVRASDAAMSDALRTDSGLVAGDAGVIDAQRTGGGLVASDAGVNDTQEGRSLSGDRAVIEIIAGPDAFAGETLERLVAAPYRVLPSSDRVGTRLEGAALARAAGYRERSRPMVIGALEVPGDGQPIVLGPEHPTTGGYPIVAVIATTELGRFFAIRLGGSVQFVVRG